MNISKTGDKEIMPRRIRDVKLRNSRPTRQQRLDREDKQVCPECGLTGNLKEE